MLLLWAAPRLALHPAPFTPVEAVEAARWYLRVAGCAAVVFAGAGLAWLQAQIPTPREAAPRTVGPREGVAAGPEAPRSGRE